MRKPRVFPMLLAGLTLAVFGSLALRGASLPALSSEQAPPLPPHSLFFVGESPLQVQRLAAASPELLCSSAVSTTTTVLPLPAACSVFATHPAPDGRWIAVEAGCDVAVFTLLYDVASGQTRPAEPAPRTESFFLNWQPKGEAYLLRVDPIGEDRILLVNATDGSYETLPTPPFTYDATFTPDGRLLYALSRGLGFGSAVWLMDADGQNREQLLVEPASVVAYPRWSPTGDALAYVRMPDSNVPFTVGELVLADAEGRNPRAVAPADAGHGYPPVWSPDGKHVAFVGRENPQDAAANISAAYLESNLYVADAASGAVRALTRFEYALVEPPDWSPDGAWLAFSCDADLWLLNLADETAYPVTQDAAAHYPVWLAGPER